MRPRRSSPSGSGSGLRAVAGRRAPAVEPHAADEPEELRLETIEPEAASAEFELEDVVDPCSKIAPPKRGIPAWTLGELAHASFDAEPAAMEAPAEEQGEALELEAALDAAPALEELPAASEIEAAAAEAPLAEEEESLAFEAEDGRGLPEPARS